MVCECPLIHSMARANLNKSINFYYHSIKVHTQETQNLHQLKSPFQTQIYLVKVPLNVNILKQILIHKKFMKWGLKGGILIDADSGPPR